MRPGILALAVACYGVSIAIRPELRTGRRLQSAAALGPALVALGPAGYRIAPLWAVLASAVAAHWTASALVRRGPAVLESARHTLLLGSCAALFTFVAVLVGGNAVDAGTVPLLLAVGGSSIPFPIGDAIARALPARRAGAPLGPMIREELRAGAPLHLVFASTAGLVSLSYSSLGAVSFAVLLLPLFATQHSFSRFADARRTYVQTVGALGRLTEVAGYVPDGHHHRVAELSVAVARELGLWGDRVRRLELVALLHDVGTVSVADPRDLASVGAPDVARAGARVLHETGYLAGQARLLTTHAEPPHEACPMEARILRVVSAYDDLTVDHADALRRLGLRTGPEDRRVYDALVRVLELSGLPAGV